MVTLGTNYTLQTNAAIKLRLTTYGLIAITISSLLGLLGFPILDCMLYVYYSNIKTRWYDSMVILATNRV